MMMGAGKFNIKKSKNYLIPLILCSVKEEVEVT